MYEPDAIVAMADGLITHFGPADRVLPQLPADTAIKNYGKDSPDIRRVHRQPCAFSANADDRRLWRAAP